MRYDGWTRNVRTSCIPPRQAPVLDIDLNEAGEIPRQDDSSVSVDPGYLHGDGDRIVYYTRGCALVTLVVDNLAGSHVFLDKALPIFRK